jgi:hypothetical protein
MPTDIVLWRFDLSDVIYFTNSFVFDSLLVKRCPYWVTTINLQGHDPAGLREFFSSLVKSASGNTGVQVVLSLNNAFVWASLVSSLISLVMLL